jgi:hypothetical protein
MFAPRRSANVSAPTATHPPISRRNPCRPAYLRPLGTWVTARRAPAEPLRHRDGVPSLAFGEVIRLISVIIVSAALCACGDELTLSSSSYVAGAGSSQSSSSGAATSAGAGNGSYVGINVIVSGLDSGTSLQFSVNGSTGGWGVIDMNGDVSVPGNETQLTVGSSYSFAITVQPPDEICAATNASGTIGSTVPPNITLTCVPRGSSQSAIAGSAATLGVKSTPFHATPPARQGAASWTDPGGRLWMFGGNGNDAEGVSVTFGDLWRLNPQSSGWSLIPSSGSAPAARAYATSWVDANGDLWLFGGQGRDPNGTAYVLNDMWKFSVSTGQWSRVSGSARKNVSGVYGLAGVAAADSLPGGRSKAVSWVDPAGTLWVFGGYGIDSTGALGTLSDLWQFTPSTGLWTWASGSVTATGT